MCHLPQSMNAGIRPPGTEQLELTREQLSSDILKLALYGLRIMLDLPAAVPRSFVFEFNLPGRQLFFSDLHFLAKLIDRDVGDLGFGHLNLLALTAESLCFDDDVNRYRR